MYFACKKEMSDISYIKRETSGLIEMSILLSSLSFDQVCLIVDRVMPVEGRGFPSYRKLSVSKLNVKVLQCLTFNR